MAKKKFNAPQGNPYTPQEQPQTTPQTTPQEAPAPTKQYYRFNAKLPLECHDFLQEMAWRNRITITEYLSRLILADMEAHPEWKETVDILNKK